MAVESKRGVPFLDFEGNHYFLLQEEKVQLLNLQRLSVVAIEENALEVRPFKRHVTSLQGVETSVQATTNKIRDTISSHSALSILAASKKVSIFECIMGRGPFRVVCSINTNYALSGYGREIQIRYRQEDLFFIGYSVAILDYVYRNKDDAWNQPKGSYLPILVRANAASSDREFEQILQDREALETMITWFKAFIDQGSQYGFDEKGLPYIEKLFEELGFFVGIAKQREKCSICFKSEPEFDEIFQIHQSWGELIVRGKNQISYFSG